MIVRDHDSSRKKLLTDMRVKMNDRDLAPPRSCRAKAGRVVVWSPPNAMMRGMEDFDGVFAFRAETT